MNYATICGMPVTNGRLCNEPHGHIGEHRHIYQTILDERRLDDELAEARRILWNFGLKFTDGISGGVMSSRHIVGQDVDVRDIFAFFERWPTEKGGQ